MGAFVDRVNQFQFTLHCVSYGGPVTTVTWTKDSEEIEGGLTVLESAKYSRYRHTLHVNEEGVYSCTVSNNKPSISTATINVAGMGYLLLHSIPLCAQKFMYNSSTVDSIYIFRKVERKYRDCIKRNGDKIGTQTCYGISM